jgi:dephospho-CoA kinase
MMQRDAATWDEASTRIAAQMPIDAKMRRGDFVIRTDGTFTDTDRQVDRILARLRA